MTSYFMTRILRSVPPAICVLLGFLLFCPAQGLASCGDYVQIGSQGDQKQGMLSRDQAAPHDPLPHLPRRCTGVSCSGSPVLPPVPVTYNSVRDKTLCLLNCGTRVTLDLDAFRVFRNDENPDPISIVFLLFRPPRLSCALTAV